MATTPRFGLLPSDDNTGRTQTWDYQAPAYASTQAIITQAGNTIVNMALTGACAITIAVGSSTTQPYAGDKIQFIFIPNGSSQTVTFSTGFAVTASTIVCTGNKYASVDFTFNGTAWQETARSITV